MSLASLRSERWRWSCNWRRRWFRCFSRCKYIYWEAMMGDSHECYPFAALILIVTGLTYGQRGHLELCILIPDTLRDNNFSRAPSGSTLFAPVGPSAVYLMDKSIFIIERHHSDQTTKNISWTRTECCSASPPPQYTHSCLCSQLQCGTFLYQMYYINWSTPLRGSGGMPSLKVQLVIANRAFSCSLGL